MSVMPGHLEAIGADCLLDLRLSVISITRKW
jgi:hypothetical protein